jgi:hypothetical protein
MMGYSFRKVNEPYKKNLIMNNSSVLLLIFIQCGSLKFIQETSY